MFQKPMDKHVVSDVGIVTKKRNGGTSKRYAFVTKAITSSGPKHDILASQALQN